MNLTKSLYLLACCTLFSTSVFASAEQAIAAAEAARKAAAEVGYEWRDTAKMIKDAKKLASEGKTDEAAKLAKKAQMQGEDAIAQYQSEHKRYQQNH